MHDDSDVIQASTHGNIRLPRLWANSKDMKTDTYSDRCSTTCRNNSTMSSSGTTSHSHAYVHHTTAPKAVVTKVVTARLNAPFHTQKSL